MKLSKLICTTLVLAILAFTNTAFAGDKCKNFSIKFKNKSGHQIKITKFQYYDYDKNKWRSEALSQRKLNNNIMWTWKRNLENVKNDETKFKVSWKIATGSMGGWITQTAIKSNKFVCKSNGSKLMTIKK